MGFVRWWLDGWHRWHYPTLCLIFHSFKISYLTLKNGSYKSIPHSPQKWIPKSHTPLSRNGSQNLIFHSPEIDPEMTKTTYFPLSQHESTLQNIHIQHFWSLGNADTPLFTRGIWKYLFLVAVEFETLYHFQLKFLPYTTWDLKAYCTTHQWNTEFAVEYGICTLPYSTAEDW